MIEQSGSKDPTPGRPRKGYSLGRQQRRPDRAALLEIDNPGKCVVPDEGRAESGLCRYTCTETGAGSTFRSPGRVRAGHGSAGETSRGTAQPPPVNSPERSHPRRLGKEEVAGCSKRARFPNESGEAAYRHTTIGRNGEQAVNTPATEGAPVRMERPARFARARQRCQMRLDCRLRVA